MTAPLTPVEFAERFQRASPTLWCIAAAVMGDRSGVEDALQEAAMIALAKLRCFDPATNFTAWMASIVRFVSLNHSRRNLRLRAASTDPHALDAIVAGGSLGRQAINSGSGRNGCASDGSAGRSRRAGMADGSAEARAGCGGEVSWRGDLRADQRTFDDRVVAALRTLDETVRCCLLMRTLRDMPYREISLALDIPEGTAMSHVYRARARLRELLVSEGRGEQSSSSDATPHRNGTRRETDSPTPDS